MVEPCPDLGHQVALFRNTDLLYCITQQTEKMSSSAAQELGSFAPSHSPEEGWKDPAVRRPLTGIGLLLVT